MVDSDRDTCTGREDATCCAHYASGVKSLLGGYLKNATEPAKTLAQKEIDSRGQTGYPKPYKYTAVQSRARVLRHFAPTLVLSHLDGRDARDQCLRMGLVL